MPGKSAMGIGPLAIDCRGMSVSVGSNIRILFQVRNNGGTTWPINSVIYLTLPAATDPMVWKFTTNAAWGPGTTSAVTATPYFPVPASWAGTTVKAMVAIWDPTEMVEYGSDSCPTLINIGAAAASGEVLFIEAAT